MLLILSLMFFFYLTETRNNSSISDLPYDRIQTHTLSPRSNAKCVHYQVGFMFNVHVSLTNATIHFYCETVLSKFELRNRTS